MEIKLNKFVYKVFYFFRYSKFYLIIFIYSNLLLSQVRLLTFNEILIKFKEITNNETYFTIQETNENILSYSLGWAQWSDWAKCSKSVIAAVAY